MNVCILFICRLERKDFVTSARISDVPIRIRASHVGIFRFVIFIETDKNNIAQRHVLIERTFIDEIGMISSFILHCTMSFCQLFVNTFCWVIMLLHFLFYHQKYNHKAYIKIFSSNLHRSYLNYFCSFDVILCSFAFFVESFDSANTMKFK